MRSMRLFLAATVAATGLVAGGTIQAAQAASTKDLTAQYGGKVIKGELFQLYGKTKTHIERQVKLQYKKGDTWKTSSISATTNASDGSFTFNGVKTSVTRKYRYVAPATEGHGKIVGNAKKVTVVKQTATGYVTPYPAYYYFLINDHFDGTVNVVLTFTPARLDRQVTFTTPNGVDIDEAYQDSKGHVVVPFNLNKPSGTYPFVVKTVAKNGAAAKSTAPIKAKVAGRALVFEPL